MAVHTSKVVPAFDFSKALKLSVSDRIQQSLSVAREIAQESGYGDVSSFPCVPGAGASEAEIKKLEAGLGVPIPPEYRQFLAVCRYLKLDDGREVGGFDFEGLYVTEAPWVSDRHREDVNYLVFANYWRYADGDQLMFDLTDRERPVVAYLHEHGPLFEAYAPSFSLALWRLVHE